MLRLLVWQGRHGLAWGLVALIGRDGWAVALATGPREWRSAPARVLLQTLLAESTK